MPRITPVNVNSVTMVTQIEVKQNNLENSEMETDASMRTCLNDVPFKLASPLVVTMSLFGLLHLSGTERRWAPITKIYSSLVLLLMWAMFIKCFTLYGSEGLGPVLLYKIVLHSWTFLGTFAATSTYMACRKQNKFVAFLTRWSTLLKMNHECEQAFEDVSLDRYTKKTKLSFNSFLIITWLGLLVSCCCLGYTFFGTNLVDFVISPMDPSHPYALPLKCFVYVIYVYLSAACVFTLCLFYNIGTVIYEEFLIFYINFQKAVRPNGDITGIGNYRKRHQEICLLVENADDILSGFSAVGILTTMVYGMLVLYNTIWYPDEYNDLVMLLSNIFWLLSCLLYLSVIAVGGGYLNHMMTMFLSKLAGESIGLTAMGMFVIDKPTILTIAGAFLTYFIVLIQFQKRAGEPGHLANCTASSVQ